MTTTTFTDLITDESQLRDVFGWPSERSLNKQIERLDQHCRAIIAKSPFLLLGTSDTTGRCDVSPKGDYPGFVRVLDEKTIAIPDLPGNNRLDTLTNMLNNPQVGLLFMIPGMNETLRVNGRARLRTDLEPKLAIVVEVTEVYLHCAKALIRSAFWSAPPPGEAMPAGSRRAVRRRRCMRAIAAMRSTNPASGARDQLCFRR